MKFSLPSLKSFIAVVLVLGLLVTLHLLLYNAVPGPNHDILISLLTLLSREVSNIIRNLFPSKSETATTDTAPEQPSTPTDKNQLETLPN